MKAFLVSDNHDSLVGMRLAGIGASRSLMRGRPMGCSRLWIWRTWYTDDN